MKPITLEWVDKAENDFNTALRELRTRKKPNYDAVCFHTQQYVEKYLKARLIEADIEFPRTHDLTRLLVILLTIEPLWIAYETELRALTDYAVEFRYPGEIADKETARKAFEIRKQIRNLVRNSLGFTS
jgi:HEPN domain-containing protein